MTATADTFLNVVSNHVTQAVAAPERFCGIFMPVFNGGSARNSLRVITPRFLCSVLRLPPPIGLLKSSLVGDLKRLTQGAVFMTKAKLFELYRAVCAAVGVKKPMGKRAVARGETNTFVEDKIIIETIRALDAMGKLKG